MKFFLGAAIALGIVGLCMYARRHYTIIDWDIVHDPQADGTNQAAHQIA